MIIEYRDQELDLRPTKIIAVARNYRAHAEEMKSDIPAEPSFFLKPPSSLLAHGGAVVLPAVSSQVEHEVELAVVIGARIKGVAPGAVKSAILGYTVLVDVTARDIQTTAKKKGMPWTIAKGYDTFAPVGPRIATPEALDPSNLDIWLAVNGDMKQQGNTNQMVFSVEALVSYVSHIMTLEPMDVVATGTPSGVGPLRDGDTVEAGIDRIGILRFNTVRER